MRSVSGQGRRTTLEEPAHSGINLSLKKGAVGSSSRQEQIRITEDQITTQGSLICRLGRRACPRRSTEGATGFFSLTTKSSQSIRILY